jgi:hypothetical protein
MEDGCKCECCKSRASSISYQKEDPIKKHEYHICAVIMIIAIGLMLML